MAALVVATALPGGVAPDRPWQAGRRWSSLIQMRIPPEILLVDKAVVVGMWLALLFLAERLWPATATRPAGSAEGWRRLARNACLWLVNTALSPLVVVHSMPELREWLTLNA